MSALSIWLLNTNMAVPPETWEAVRTEEQLLKGLHADSPTPEPRLYVKETHFLILKYRSEGLGPAAILSRIEAWWGPSSYSPTALLKPEWGRGTPSWFFLLFFTLSPTPYLF